MASKLLLRVCLFFAALKVVGAIVVYTIGTQLETVSVSKIPNGVFVLHIVIFGATGIWLIYASRSDARAKHLGVVFFLIASSFSDASVRHLPEVLDASWGFVGPLLSSLQPDAFEPYFLWLFFCEFPRGFSSSTTQRLFRLGLKVSLCAGIALFLVNLIGLFSPPASNASGALSVLSVFDRNAPVLYYWMLKYALEIPVLPISLWKTRNAPIEERRRVRFFLVGLAIGSLPVMLVVLLEAMFPSFHARMSIPSWRSLAALILYPLILSIPITTAYSVLVHRVLEIKLIIRRALWYGFARYGVILLAAIPFCAFGFYLYQRREETVSGLLSGLRLPVFLAAIIVVLLVVRQRRRVFDTIDRRYFREQYDSRTILANLVEKSRVTDSVEELSTLLSAEIDRALHLDSVAILVRRPDVGDFRSPNGDIRPLSSSALLALVAGSSEPLDIDLEDPRSLLKRLSLEDQEWLADGAFRLLVPMIASDGRLIGLITLGDKKSELRFSAEDRILLKTIAAAVALTLENRLLRSSRRRGSKSAPPSSWESRSVEDALANQCLACHCLQSPLPSSCIRCGGKVETTHVPHLLLGKFRLERRIGAGGMGVVYRAVDLNLNRAVAIKTLPKVSPDYSMRLRREARAMAAIAHPNLALIFGAEAWHGTPMLIFEYLEGGTLADRLLRAPFSLKQTLELGLVLASVLERTHGAGILHRDIKPSNIGYTADEIPKLLDFGLAHVLNDSRREFQLRNLPLAEMSALSTVSLRPDDLVSLTMSNHIVGTPVYLSPEAVQNKRPDPSFDLWAVSIVLYEALTGRNPMARGSLSETLAFISRGIVPDIRESLPNCSGNMAIFLNEALATDIARRPSTAGELRGRLERVISTIE